MLFLYPLKNVLRSLFATFFYFLYLFTNQLLVDNFSRTLIDNRSKYITLLSFFSNKVKYTCHTCVYGNNLQLEDKITRVILLTAVVFT